MINYNSKWFTAAAIVFMVYLFINGYRGNHSAPITHKHESQDSDTLARYTIEIGKNGQALSWYEKLILKIAGYGDSSEETLGTPCKAGESVVLEYTAPDGSSTLHNVKVGERVAAIPEEVTQSIAGMRRKESRALFIGDKQHSIKILK